MTTRRRWVLALPLLGAFPSWGATAPAAAQNMARRSRVLMGTRVDVVVPVVSASALPQLIQSIDLAFERMQRLEALMSRYRTDSEVHRIADGAGRRPVQVSPEVMAVLRHARNLHRDTRGAFDITVGALRGWSFEAGHEREPSRIEVARQLALVNMGDLELEPRAGKVFLRRKGMALDLGGIAKLPILEAGLQSLRDVGIGDALINGGGDVLIAGSHHGQPWRVGVRDPNAPHQLLGILSLQGQGVVASSGDYERSFVRDGRRLHHVLDPRTGLPTQGVHGVALRAEHSDEVNGWGAALMVRGVSAATGFSAQRRNVDLMAGMSDGTHWLSDGMRQRLTPA